MFFSRKITLKALVNEGKEKLGGQAVSSEADNHSSLSEGYLVFLPVLYHAGQIWGTESSRKHRVPQEDGGVLPLRASPAI